MLGGWGDIFLWICGYIVLAILLAGIGEWFIKGWSEIEAADEPDAPPPFGSPRWVRRNRENEE